MPIDATNGLSARPGERRRRRECCGRSLEPLARRLLFERDDLALRSKRKMPIADARRRDRLRGDRDVGAAIDVRVDQSR
jgi:hypothetical protein